MPRHPPHVPHLSASSDSRGSHISESHLPQEREQYASLILLADLAPTLLQLR